MVRSLKIHHQEEEEEDEDDFISRTTDGSSHRGDRKNDQKASSHRSKHSETEQRRRSKINERFQILRDLIPENDQKRDRASFLLEVIQYIQFLQEKLQVYEGTYQGWSPELSKLMPWRGTDTFADQSQPIKSGSVDMDNIVFTHAMLTDPHNLVEPVDHADVSLQQNTYEPGVDLLTSQSSQQTWNGIQNSTPNVLEESSISNAYSKGLLNNLTNALGSSGVDLSQASISVQLDIKKAASVSFGIKDHGFSYEAMTQCGGRRGDDVSVREHKRLRTEENQ